MSKGKPSNKRQANFTDKEKKKFNIERQRSNKTAQRRYIEQITYGVAG